MKSLFIVFIIISIALSYTAYTYYKKSNVCDQNMAKQDNDYKMKISKIEGIVKDSNSTIDKKEVELKKLGLTLSEANDMIAKNEKECAMKISNIESILKDANSTIDKKEAELKKLGLSLTEATGIIAKKDEELKKIQVILGDVNTTITKKEAEVSKLGLSLSEATGIIAKRNDELKKMRDDLDKKDNECNLKISRLKAEKMPDNTSGVKGSYESVLCNQIIIFDNQKGYINLGEIEVYDGNRKLIPISESSLKMTGELSIFPVKNLIDKNITTFAHNDSEDGVRKITISFPSPVNVSAIVITNRQDCCKTRANGLMVQALLDGKESYLSNPIKDWSGSSVYNNGGTDTFNPNGYNYVFFIIPNPQPNISNEAPI